jgi:putative aldouronate transport system permease protein
MSLIPQARSGLRSRADTMSLYLLMLPGLVLVGVFAYGPMYGILIAFKDYYPARGIFGSPWVGLDHFSYMLEMPDTWRVIRNTVVISVLKIVLGFPVPVIFALLLNEVNKAWFRKSVQTVIYLPNFLSWVILGGIFLDIFSVNGGLLNRAITTLFGWDPVYFLGDKNWFVWVLVFTDIWKNFGFQTVIYVAALSAIDSELYESAIIDGANRWKQTLHVTLPGILPIVILMATLNMGNILNAGFDQVFNLYNPLVYETADIIDTYVYRLAFVDGSYSFSTAVGLLKSLVSLVFIVAGYRIAYKVSGYKIF